MIFRKCASSRLAMIPPIVCVDDDLQAEPILTGEMRILPPEATTRIVTCIERCFQSMFRSVVLARYKGQSAVSGLKLDSLFEAAHIVPWSEDETVRLEPNNGLALNPLMHKAYYQHLLGIYGVGTIHISKELIFNAGSRAMRNFFYSIEQTKIFMPKIGRPSEELLDRHFQDYLRHHS